MSRKYILDDKDNPVLCDDMAMWLGWLGSAQLAVKRTRLDTAGVAVSTIFLGLDYQDGDGPPLLYETITYRCDEYGRLIDFGPVGRGRSATRDEAIQRHDTVVRELTGAA